MNMRKKMLLIALIVIFAISIISSACFRFTPPQQCLGNTKYDNDCLVDLAKNDPKCNKEIKYPFLECKNSFTRIPQAGCHFTTYIFTKEQLETCTRTNS